MNDLSDALAAVPGVALDGIGLGNRGIRIRGMDTDHTLVLVDGARISTSASAVAHSDYEHGWIPAAANATIPDDTGRPRLSAVACK